MLEYLSKHAWGSVHGTVVQDAVRIAYPKNLDDQGGAPAQDAWRLGLAALQQLIGDAKADHATLLPLGSAWSLSEVLRASPNGWRVVTNYLNHVPFIGLRPAYLAATSILNRKRLVFAQAGCTVFQLHGELVPRGLTLSTTGASCGQTLGGAISTGTHGAAVRFGPMHEMVRGIHLVTSEHRSVWLEPASRPAASDAFCAHLGAEPLRDDALFESALVAFGTMGIVHGYLLEVEPLFLLRRYFRGSNLALLDGHVRRVGTTFHVDPEVALPESLESLFHFEVVSDPNDVDDDVVLNIMHRVGPVPAYAWTPNPTPSLGVGDDILHDIGKFTPLLGTLANKGVKKKVSELLASIYPLEQHDPKVGILAEMFARSEVPNGGHSAEIGVDVNDWVRAFRTVLGVIRARPRAHAGLVSARFVPASAATLAFTRFPVTCTIELPVAKEVATLPLFRGIWQALRQAGIPFTLHWGQACEFGVATVTEMYGAASVQGWREARETLLGPAGMALFRNALFDASGL
jgi:hypothetical protein